MAQDADLYVSDGRIRERQLKCVSQSLSSGNALAELQIIAEIIPFSSSYHNFAHFRQKNENVAYISVSMNEYHSLEYQHRRRRCD